MSTNSTKILNTTKTNNTTNSKNYYDQYVPPFWIAPYIYIYEAIAILPSYFFDEMIARFSKDNEWFFGILFLAGFLFFTSLGVVELALIYSLMTIVIPGWYPLYIMLGIFRSIPLFV